MYCTNCGNQIENEARFCPYCGALAATEMKSGMRMENVRVPDAMDPFTPGQRVEGKEFPEKGTSKKTYWLLALLGTVAVAAIAAIVVVSYLLMSGKSVEAQAAEQLKLGNRYLEEMDYEQAVVAFHKTIEIDPSNVEAYLGASTAYTALGNYQEAVNMLDAGYEATEDLQIAERGQAVCLEAAEHYIGEENYEEAEKYIEKGKGYGDSEELDKAEEKLQEVSREEEKLPLEYTWSECPGLESDDVIYYLNNANPTYGLMEPVNLTRRQSVERAYGYAVVRRGDSYGLVNMDGNFLDGLNFSKIEMVASNYRVTYAEPHTDSYGLENTTANLYEGNVMSSEGPGDYAGIGFYFWNQGLRQITEGMYRAMPEPEVPIPVFAGEGEDVYLEMDPDGFLKGQYQKFSGKCAIYAGGGLTTDFIYDECGSYSEGLFAVSQNGKWGYVNKNGEVVVPIEYDASWKEYIPFESYGGSDEGMAKDYCYAASDGYVVLRQGDAWELRDVQGRLAVPQGEFEELLPVYGNRCWAKKDGKWGVLRITPDSTAADNALQSDTGTAEVIDSGTCGTNLTWEMDSGGTLTISGEGEMDEYTEETAYSGDIDKLPSWQPHKAEIQTVVAKDGVKSIGRWAFSGYENLKQVVLADTVEYVDRAAFENCVQLEQVSFGNGMKIVVKAAFSECKNLQSVEFPEGFTGIGSYAFSGCTSLKEVRFPRGVNEMDASAFADCFGIERIVFEGDVPEIYAASSAYEPRLFDGLTATVYFPAGNVTYTEEVRQQYFGGGLTWKPI